MKYKPVIHAKKVEKELIVVNLIMAGFYFSWWLVISHVGNIYLYLLLLLGEVYHVTMSMLFWFTIWPGKIKMNRFSPSFGERPDVDIFITVAGEPKEVVRKTALAAIGQDYNNHKVFLLNDGFVLKKDNWEEAEELASELGINCITRKVPGGSKAGNVNNALRNTWGEIIVIFDADMVPRSDFLSTLIPYFKNKKVGFVQSPQYYHNQGENLVTQGSWGQQELFFGPIMRGKEKDNSVFICGTNFAIRRVAIVEAGGMCESSIAEDFVTSLFVHMMGWRSYYVKDVLAQGLAPQDFLSYFKQQLRWARGSLDLFFSFNPLFQKGLSWPQKFEYLSSSMYYLNGPITIVDLIMPLFFLFGNIVPVSATSTSFALFFVPFMFLNIYSLYLASDKKISFRALSFSFSSWTIQLLALKSVLLKQKMAFSITPKQAEVGDYTNLVYPHIFYILIAIAGSVVAILREGFDPAVTTNMAWTVFNSIMFIPFIMAARPQKKFQSEWERKSQMSIVKWMYGYVK